MVNQWRNRSPTLHKVCATSGGALGARELFWWQRVALVEGSPIRRFTAGSCHAMERATSVCSEMEALESRATARPQGGNTMRPHQSLRCGFRSLGCGEAWVKVGIRGVEVGDLGELSLRSSKPSVCRAECFEVSKLRREASSAACATKESVNVDQQVSINVNDCQQVSTRVDKCQHASDPCHVNSTVNRKCPTPGAHQKPHMRKRRMPDPQWY